MNSPQVPIDLVTWLPQGALVHDLDGNLLAANAPAERLLAGSPILHDVTAAVSQSDPPPWHVAAIGHPALAELCIGEGEQIRWVTAQSARTELADAQVVVTTLMDHSERLQMVRRLMDDFVLQFDASWRHTSTPVFLADADSDSRGHLVTANPALGRLLGVDPRELVGRPITELFLGSATDGSTSRLIEDVVAGLADGRIEHHAAHGVIRGTPAAGHAVQLDMVSTRGPSGRPAFLLGYMFDEERLAATVRQHHLEQRRLERIFTHGSDIVVVISADGRFAFIGPSSLNVLGYDRRDLIGTNVTQLIHPDDRGLALEALADTARVPGPAAPLQMRVRDRDDDWRHVEVVANNLLDDPEIAGIVITIRDRSGEATAEAQLAEREARYRQIVELSVDGIAVVDAEHRITFASPRLAEILRCRTSDLLGRTVIELITPEDREIVTGAMRRRRMGVEERFPVRMVRGDDDLAHVIVSASPHMVDGEMVGAVAWVTDITEAERTRDDLRRSEQHMRALLSAIPDLIFRMDREGTYLEHHCSDPQLLLLPPEQFLGRTIHEVIPEGISPGTAQQFHECILHTLDTGEGTSHEYQLDLPNGTHCFEARFAAAGTDEVLAVVRDISNLKLSERQRIEHSRDLIQRDEQLRRAAIEHELERASRVEAMGYLAGTMAHDVNNLLGVINNYAAGIEHSDAPERVRYDASEIRAAVRSGADLTGRLLSIGRRSSAAPVEVDLTELVRDVGRRLSAAFDPTGQVHLVVEPSDRECWADVEPARIEQAIMNLILNARDATIEHHGSGEIALALELRHVGEDDELPPGCYAVVAVSDSGAGISDEVVPRMWEPFYSTKGESGTGLGLPIVRQIADQHRGTVLLRRDDAASGTRIELWLPAFCEPGAPTEAADAGHVDVADLILVDDNDRLLHSTARLLAGSGFNVRPVRSAEEAMALMDEGRPAALLTDVRMPRISGLELARWVRRRHPAVPIAFMTGYEGDLGPTDDLFGATALTKPFSPEDLRAVAQDLRAAVLRVQQAPR